ncbi:hypothetical protein KKG71_04620 [Patescibacteria group bacterium]|nr:hypothetical protein [Patescibacteria group bacterium]
MANDIITKTRRGYAYQDKFALLKLLRIFVAGEKIVEFSVDKPFGKRRSLDIEIIYEEKEREIYEIKTGKKFKEKRIEIWQELITLRKYDSYDKYTKIITVDPELPTEFIYNWGDICLIANSCKRKENNNGETMLKVANRCHKDIAKGENINIFNNNVEIFIKFMKNVKIEIGCINSYTRNTEMYLLLNAVPTDIQRRLPLHYLPTFFACWAFL